MAQARAPLFAARRRYPHWAFGVVPATPPAGLPIAGPGDPIGLTVEIYVNSAWTDVSPYVRYGSRVRISRGRPDETSSAQPQSCALTLDNRDGRFSPRNPVGPYYGQLGRNTPLRVSRLNNGVRRYRFYGEVPSWPMVSDISGKDVTVSVQAAGMLRRLAQGNRPLRSALFRAYTLGYNSTQFFYVTPLKPVGYWPCEDGTAAVSIASGLPGGTPMALSGQALPTFASNTAFPGSAALPLLSASVWTGAVPAHTGGAANVMRFFLFVPATGAYDTGVIARMYTAGAVARVDVAYSVASGGSLTVAGYDAGGASLFSQAMTFVSGPSLSTLGINGLAIVAEARLSTFGGSVTYDLAASGIGFPGSGLGSGFGPLGGIGNAARVVVNPDGHLDDTAVGHVTVQTAIEGLGPIFAPANAYDGESPIIRFGRLCGEQNVPAVNLFVTGGVGDATAMGPQPVDTFPSLIQECADALFLPVFEARDQLSLVMRSKGTMYNQAAHLTLDMAAHELSGPLVPVDDDALTRNDVTVTAVDGSSAQVVQATGVLSTAPFPAGVGDYETDYSLNLSSGISLANQAGWRLLFGTLDEPRYPQVPVNLRYPAFTGSVDLMNAALTIDVGDRLVVVNPPAPDFPPDPISMIVQGYTETLGVWEHDVVFNCSPEAPWRVGLADDVVLGRADTDGSTLAGDCSASAVTLLVATTTAGSPLWTTSGPEFPFDVVAGGERMTVTNITGVSSPQTFTVTRSVNGVVKSQTAGTDVRLQQPMILSL